jgi:hypothetical protein
LADAAVAFSDLCTFGQGFGLVGKLDVTAVAAAVIGFGILDVSDCWFGASIFRALVRVSDLASREAKILELEGIEGRQYHGKTQDRACCLHRCGSLPNIEVLDTSRLWRGQLISRMWKNLSR